LPRATGKVHEAAFPTEPAEASAPATEIILVVEDDDRVRHVTVTRLKMIGYEVLEAQNGRTALQVLAGASRVDILFTDLIMPGGLSGRQVASRARQVMPNIRVPLTSGYAEDLVHADELQRERLSVLRKPYRQAELLAQACVFRALREANCARS
jgi:CheY-like chemotaxis protein